MIGRYVKSEMARLWSEEHKYETWLEVELLACEAWTKKNVIPQADMDLLRSNASININRIAELESDLGHDVIAFTRAVSESLGEESRWIHYGMTSTDLVDTSLSYRLKQSNKLLLQNIDHLLQSLADLAKKHKYTVMIGRTHGVHAEPITFGLKMALWYTEMQRNRDRMLRAAEIVEVGKISGAVGTYANIDPYIEDYVCEKLGLQKPAIATQTLQRDRHAEYIALLALIATSLDKFATEIRHLQRTEVREVEEPFGTYQKGSSAMPHKRNPISCENICGLSRLMRGYISAAYENVALWHERDISHSSVERVILPDAVSLLDYMLRRFTGVVRGLNVHPDNMLDNMNATFGLIYSQQVLLAAIQKGLQREEAYDCIQDLSKRAWDEKLALRDLIKQDGILSKLFTDKDLDACFDYSQHLRYVDHIFEQCNLI